MEFVVTPSEGVGPVKLGMSRQHVRATLSGLFTTFRQGPFAVTDKYLDTDFFTSLGIQVDYTTTNICNFITAVAEARPTFQDRPIVGEPFSACRAWLASLDNQFEIDGAGLISRKLGISIYASGALKDPMDPVEAVSVFSDGYYD